MERLVRSPVVWMVLLCGVLSGCAAFPDRRVQPQFRNPFPQIHRVAVLPFYNQSAEPTVDGEAVAMAYYNELQAIPGFEVMPVGVAKQLMAASGIEPRTASDFQKLARAMGMDAVLVGSVTEYSPYYPPRMGLAVDWYAANPSFHPVPAGYGLPWGRAEEEYIPSPLVEAAEFELAREQLKTQTPAIPPQALEPAELTAEEGAQQTSGEESPTETAPKKSVATDAAGAGSASEAEPLPPPLLAPGGLPLDWPDPRGFVPLPPQAERPKFRPQYEPIITHTRIYHGQDAEFTQRLENYFFFRDDARFGGWGGYLERPDDFLRFCCHLHVTETLAARGGAGEGRVVWRWPIGRYDP